MFPSHIPILLKIYCSSILCKNNIGYVQDLLRTNLGPQINHSDHIYCQLSNTFIQCDIYSPWNKSYSCCKQLYDTFSAETLAYIMEISVEKVEIDCDLPIKYKKYEDEDKN